MKKIILLFVLSIILSGCKVEIASPVSISDLINKKSQQIESEVSIEVTSCTDYEDSRNESSSLIKAKKSILSIFPNAKYVGCYSKKFTSKANFKIISYVGDNKSFNGLRISMDGKGEIRVSVSNEVVNSVKKAQKNTLSTIEPEIKVILKNDTDKMISSTFIGVFMNGEGNSVISGEINKKTFVEFTLSNSSCDELFRVGSTIFGYLSIK